MMGASPPTRKQREQIQHCRSDCHVPRPGPAGKTAAWVRKTVRGWLGLSCPPNPDIQLPGSPSRVTPGENGHFIIDRANPKGRFCGGEVLYTYPRTHRTLADLPSPTTTSSPAFRRSPLRMPGQARPPPKKQKKKKKDRAAGIWAARFRRMAILLS